MEIIQYPLIKWLEMNTSELSSMNIGFDGDLYLLSDKSDQSMPHRNHEFVIQQIIDPENILVYDMFPTDNYYPFVHPLPDNHLLLANSYTIYHGNQEFDVNAYIYNIEGELVHQSCLGDEIADVQTTADGLIWTSYFLEGVLGSYDWPLPFGRHGLNQWDREGNLMYKYHPKLGLDTILGCYALNVTSKNETWCYYSPDFPLVRLLDNQVVDFWEPPVKYATSFAVWKNYVLFDAGYERDNIFTLLKLEDNHQTTIAAKLQFTIEDDQPLIEFKHKARGNIFFLVKSGHCYRVDLRDILEYLGLPR